MASLFRSAPTRPVWLALLLLSAVGLYLADARLGLLEAARGVLLTALQPLQHLAALPAKAWNESRDALRSREALEAENAQLREERKLLQAQMQTFWSVEQENARLRSALNAVAPLQLDVMLADVLRSANTNGNPHLLIDRGSREGVYVGQAALLGAGVLGQVVHVGAQTAEILPLSDERIAIPVRVARSGQRGIVHGTGSLDELRVHHLPKQADIAVGDVLITSGLGGGFPEGFPVASVTHISAEQSGAFADIRARPMTNLADVRDVVLVWLRPNHAMPAGAMPKDTPPTMQATEAPPPPAATGQSATPSKPAHAQ